MTSGKRLTPETLFEELTRSIEKIRKEYSGKIFVRKAPPRIDLASVDSKISRFNDLLSIGLSSGTSSSDLIVVETTEREIRFFNKDSLHLNKHKRCTALAGSILKCLYSVLRPLCKKDKSRHNPKDMGGSRKSGFRSKHKHTVINSRKHYSGRPSSKSRTSVDYVGWGLGDNEVAFRSEPLPLPCSSHDFLNSQDCDGVLGPGLGGVIMKWVWLVHPPIESQVK